MIKNNCFNSYLILDFLRFKLRKRKKTPSNLLKSVDCFLIFIGFSGRKIDGIWHTAIVVYGKEYYFGSGGIGAAIPVRFYFHLRR